MENIFLRFPHLSEMIFDKLDVQGIKYCREVNHSWRRYLDTEYKRHQIRLLKRTIRKFTQLDKSLIEFLDNANSENIKRLGISMDHFSEKEQLDWTSEQIAFFLKNTIRFPDFLKGHFEDFGTEGILDNWIGLDFKHGRFEIKFRTKYLAAVCISLFTEEMIFRGYEFIELTKTYNSKYVIKMEQNWNGVVWGCGTVTC